MNSPTDESLSHLTEAQQASTESHKDHGYEEMPECVKHVMSHEEWLWHPDKDNILEEMCRPEVPEDG
jgi:hypothetical protein